MTVFRSDVRTAANRCLTVLRRAGHFAASERVDVEKYLASGKPTSEVLDSISNELCYARGAVRLAYQRLFDRSVGTAALLSSPLRRSDGHDPAISAAIQRECGRTEDSIRMRRYGLHGR